MKIINRVFSKVVYYVMLFTIALIFNQCKEPASLNALIVSDSDEETTSGLQTILENTGLFDANITKSSSPDFADYDVVVLYLSKSDWSEKTKSDFISYVQTGGGVVFLGASAPAFGDWAALNEVAGTPVTEKLKKSKSVFEYQVVNSKKNHPIIEGLQPIWMHSDDFMLFNTEKLNGEIEVLATSWADTLQGGSGAHLPVLLTVSFGEGRVFHSTLGVAATSENLAPIQCVGFITTLQRGAEWAATGVVSQEVSIDFPNIASTHEWVDYKPMTLDEILERASTYEIGKSKKYLTDFSMRIRNCDGMAETYTTYEDRILEFLASDATVDSKKYMCRELSWMGSTKSISVLEKLVNDKDLSESASYALQRLRM